MKKKILILAGGFSKEREISLITSKSVQKALNDSGKYITKINDPKDRSCNEKPHTDTP
mgnify:CR=1 FL=1